MEIKIYGDPILPANFKWSPDLYFYKARTFRTLHHLAIDVAPILFTIAVLVLRNNEQRYVRNRKAISESAQLFGLFFSIKAYSVPQSNHLNNVI